MDLKIPIILFFLACSCTSESQQQKEDRVSTEEVLTDCEWCGSQDAPDNLSWSSKIAPENESGIPMEFTGTVYNSDGVTPEKGVLVYAYHTNAKGVYPKNGNETGNGKRHGYLRGWTTTNEEGRFRFISIKPEIYPSRNEAAHIHVTIKEEGKEEYWILSTLFIGDTLIDPDFLIQEQSKGKFSSIVELNEMEDGKVVVERNIRLR